MECETGQFLLSSLSVRFAVNVQFVLLLPATQTLPPQCHQVGERVPCLNCPCTS